LEEEGRNVRSDHGGLPRLVIGGRDSVPWAEDRYLFVGNLDRAKEWYGLVLGIRPYFDEPFYVGFNVGGFELGLQPDGPNVPCASTGVIAYWGVDDANAAVGRLLELGATEHSGVQDVGDDIRVATVLDPYGNVLDVIRNPHFSLEHA
jgi:predicted enzyme related to lactoylglutathione lyase